MRFEVEQKFAVTDMARLHQQLVSMGAAFAAPVVQVDRYFGHPLRDFARTDEALRLRQIGLSNYVTYKGPKIDATTKTRREIELALQEGSETAERWVALLDALGFTSVATVRKRRHPGRLVWQDVTVEVALDQVEGLGEFVELELAAEEAELDAAKSKIQSLVDRLELSAPERRSYLELLLARE